MHLNTKIFSSVSTKSFILGFIILMACSAFVLTGFGSLNPGNLFGLDPNTAAQVGAEKIDMQQFSAVVSSRRPNDSTPEQRKAYAHQVIQQMIQDRILTEQSKKIGWITSDYELATFIKNIPQFQNSETNQFEMKLLKDYLEKINISEISFYNYLKQQIEIQKINNLLYIPTPLPNKLLEMQNAVNNTEFNLQYAVISIPDSLLKLKISEQAQKYANDKTNESNLLNFYQNSKNKYQQQAKVRAQSILISYNSAERAQGDALKRTKEDAKSLAQQIKIKLSSGADFSALATMTNDDFTAKKNKGDIGYVDETNIDHKSAQSVLTLTSQNPISDIIDTPFGFRIFKFIEGKPAISKSFEEVKLKVAEQIIGNEVKQKLDLELQKEISEAIVAKNISKINNILSTNQINWQYLSKLYKVSNYYIDELGMASNLAQNIFSLQKPGDFIPNVLSFGSKKVIIKLVSRHNPVAASSQQIKDLKKEMMQASANEFAENTKQHLLQNYEKNGKIKINPAILN